MSVTFFILSFLLIISAIAAMSVRNLIHCALYIVISFATVGVIFVYQGAEFVGLVQILVYVGAVAVLIVFAILLVRGSDFGQMPSFIRSWKIGVLISALLFVTIVLCVLNSENPVGLESNKTVKVEVIGKELMTKYILPLEVIGLLLTTALLGGVLLVKRDKINLKTDLNKNE